MKSNVWKSLYTFLVIGAFLLILSSCNKSSAQINRSIEVFLMGVLQVANIILFGIAALVLCIVGSTSTKPTLRTVGAVFLGLFSFFTLLGLVKVIDLKPRHMDIFTIFFLEFIIITISLVFALKERKHSQKVIAQEQDVIDKTLDEEI